MCEFRFQLRNQNSDLQKDKLDATKHIYKKRKKMKEERGRGEGEGERRERERGKKQSSIPCVACRRILLWLRWVH